MKHNSMAEPVIRIACFSAAGERLGHRIGSGEVTRFPGELSLADWTRSGFQEADALIFTGACQIAVRAVAPFVRSKLTDPAVLVVDETGAYVIPILSGHLGRANDLAERIAKRLGALCVVTTATDRRKTFAADSWAVENGLGIVNPEAVKGISAALLDGEEIVIGVRRRTGSPENLHREAAQEDLHRGAVQEDLHREAAQEDLHREAAPGSRMQEENLRGPGVLRLVPRRVIIGAGCRRGTDPAYFEKCLLGFCEKHGIARASVFGIASIDLKKEEPALRQLAEKWKIPFLTYSAALLMETPGRFSSSAYVLQKTGADNVCERAAVRASMELDPPFSGPGMLPPASGCETLPPSSGCGISTEDGEEIRERLIHKKETFEGITLAASRMRTVRSWIWV